MGFSYCREWLIYRVNMYNWYECGYIEDINDFFVLDLVKCLNFYLIRVEMFIGYVESINWSFMVLNVDCVYRNS